MHNNVLLKYLKIAKNYASEKDHTDFKLLSNVLIDGNYDSLSLTCCDGTSGINIKIPNYEGSKILGEYCLNIYDLYNIINAIDIEQDLEFILKDSYVKISGKNFTKKMPVLDSSSIYNIPTEDNWEKISLEFLKELELACLNAVNDDSFSISVQDKLIVSQIPDGLFFVNSSQNFEFISYKKYISKIFIDEFTDIAISENRISFKNNHIKLFIPIVVENKKNIKMIVDNVNNYIDNEYHIPKFEINQASKIINSTLNDEINNSVYLTFTDKELSISSLDTDISIPCHHQYGNAKEIKIKIHKKSLKILDKIDSEKIIIKLSENDSRCFYCQGGKMVFLGKLLL